MRQNWAEEELIERWTLAPDEPPLLANKTGATRLGFAVLLRFFAGEGRFPRSKGEVSDQVVAYVGRQFVSKNIHCRTLARSIRSSGRNGVPSAR